MNVYLHTFAVVCRNAYIMVAVPGSGYCTSAFHAAKLILNNILRIAAVNTVGDALLWVGKVCIQWFIPSDDGSTMQLTDSWHSCIGVACNCTLLTVVYSVKSHMHYKCFQISQGLFRLCSTATH